MRQFFKLAYFETTTSLELKVFTVCKSEFVERNNGCSKLSRVREIGEYVGGGASPPGGRGVPSRLTDRGGSPPRRLGRGDRGGIFFSGSSNRGGEPPRRIFF